MEQRATSGTNAACTEQTTLVIHALGIAMHGSSWRSRIPDSIPITNWNGTLKGVVSSNWNAESEGQSDSGPKPSSTLLAVTSAASSSSELDCFTSL